MTDSQKYSNKLHGARILVIGGSSGIGYCVAEACLEFGASVIISSSQQSRIDSSIDKLLQTYPSAKGRIAGYACDLSSPSVEANIQTLLEQCTTSSNSISSTGSTTKLNHIVHTAGNALATGKLQDATLASLQAAAMVRFNSALFLAKHAPAHMHPGPAASITLTTGAVGTRPHRDWSQVAGYAAGLHGLTRNLALDLAPLRVNLVSPGAVLTPLWDAFPTDRKEAIVGTYEKKNTTGRIGRPEDVAECYLYLMRDANVAGSVVESNGGMLLTD